MAASSTILVISGPGLPPYSSRGLTQTIEPIIPDAAKLRRTVNGTLVSLVPEQFNKYKSKITGSDMDSPALDGIFIGQPLTVSCLVELSYVTIGGTPLRPVVSGSARTDGPWTFYRPQLAMLVVNYSIQRDEWGGVVGWDLELEEV